MKETSKNMLIQEIKIHKRKRKKYWNMLTESLYSEVCYAHHQCRWMLLLIWNIFPFLLYWTFAGKWEIMFIVMMDTKTCQVSQKKPLWDTEEMKTYFKAILLTQARYNIRGICSLGASGTPYPWFLQLLLQSRQTWIGAVLYLLVIFLEGWNQEAQPTIILLLRPPMWWSRINNSHKNKCLQDTSPAKRVE